MKVRDILGTKGHEVVTVTPDRTVLDAMRILVEHNIGSVVVTDGEEVVGILTERDILRLGADDPGVLLATAVHEAMTTDLVIGVPGDEIEYVMEVMTRNRVRHLPILDGDRLVGIVSIGDVVKASHEDTRRENRYLRNYIRGEVR